MIERCLSFLNSRPLVPKLILVFIGLLAIITGPTIERLGLPQVDLNQMTITTLYPGATPLDVELNVTVKIEEAITEVEGIKYFTSRSYENASKVFIYLDEDAQRPQKTKQEIRDAIHSINDLPSELENDPHIFEVKVQSFPVYEVAMIWPDGNFGDLKSHAQELKKKILRLPSVAKVLIPGNRDREFQIQLSLKKMKEKKVSFEEVIQAISDNKIRASGGVIESYISQTGIVTLSEFQTPNEISQIIVRSNLEGKVVKIQDIGKVVDTFEKEENIIRYNGQQGLGLWVYKTQSADAIDCVDQVKEVVLKYQKENASSAMTFTSTLDYSRETRTRLSMVIKNTLFGFLLVMVVLFCFFHPPMAFWTALGIPISVALTLLAFPILGITINSVSLCGLIVVLGMVVDDAIIIAESIYRQMENGHSKAKASILGVKKVIRPITGTIVTTVLAFCPLYFIPGVLGKFGREIPTVVIAMLFASVIEAFFLLPTHIAQSSPPKAKNSPSRGEKIFKFFEKNYRKLLDKLLDHKAWSSLLLLSLLALGTYLGPYQTPYVMFPTGQAHKIFLFGEVKRGSTLKYTSSQSRHIDKIISELPGEMVESFRTFNGDERPNIKCRQCFYTKILLSPASQRDLSAQEVVDLIKEKLDTLQQKGTTAITKLTSTIDSGGPQLGKPLEVQVIGEDANIRQAVLEHVQKELKNWPLEDIKSDYRLGASQFLLTPDASQIAKSGLNVSQIANTIRTAYEGQVVAHLQTPSEKIPFRVMLDDASKTQYASLETPLRGLYVPNPQNLLIPLSRLVKKEIQKEEVSIYHYDGERSNAITANIKSGSSLGAKELYQKLSNVFQNIQKEFPGFSILIKGEAEEGHKTFIQITLAFLAALSGIYFVLVLQFNSLIQPFFVIMPVPFGLAGIGLMFSLHGMDFSFISLLGIVGFTGVVVNDSLIMVEFINSLKKGESHSFDDIKQTIIEGASHRLRPILLTTVTTLAGLFPSAYAFMGDTDIFISPMVMAMGWGLFFGTFSVLVVIPLVYAINWAITEKTKNWFASTKD